MCREREWGEYEAERGSLNLQRCSILPCILCTSFFLTKIFKLSINVGVGTFYLLQTKKKIDTVQNKL